MQRYNQRMVEQLKARQQQEKARLPKIQRSEGKTRMAMYKKSLHINGAGSAAEQREKVKQVGAVRQGACERVQVTAQRPPPCRSPAPPPPRFLSSTKTPLTCPSAAWAPVTQTGPRVTTQCRVPISPEAGSQPAGEGLSVMGPRRAPEAAPLSPS